MRIANLYSSIVFCCLVVFLFYFYRHSSEQAPKRCVHKALAHRYNPTDGADSSLMRLPTEIVTQILQQIASTQPEDLESLLIGVPALCNFVLLVTDHQSNPHALFRATACDTISLEEFDKDPRQAMRYKFIKVFSFLKTDEVVGQDALTRDESCLYGRYLNQFTPVFVGGRGTLLVGGRVLKQLTKAKHAPPPVLIRTCNDKHVQISIASLESPVTSSHVLFPYCLILRDPDVPVIFLGPSFLPPPLGYERVWFWCWRKIKRVSVSDLSSFGGTRQRMPWVESLKITFRKERPTLWRYGARWPLIGFRYAPRLREIYIEYEHPYTPFLSSGPLTSSKLGAAVGKFSFVNTKWSPYSPFRREPVNQDTMSSGQIPLEFLRHFKEATFRGVPDVFLELSDLSVVQKLTYKRLMPTEILESNREPFHIHSGGLHHLNITTFLTDKRVDPMPRFHAPNLETLELHALPGSTEKWDISTVLWYTTRSPHLKKVHIEQDDSVNQPPLGFSLSGLRPVADTVEDLTIRGYIPSFAHPDSARQQESYRLKRVTKLDIDINNMPIKTADYATHVPVVISERQFPALENLHLHVDVATPEIHDGYCRVTVDAPPLCKRLSFDGMYETDGCVVDGQTLCGTRYADRVSYQKVDGLWTRDLHDH